MIAVERQVTDNLRKIIINSVKRFAIGAILTVSLVNASALAHDTAQPPDADAHTKVGDRVPAFQVTDMSGKPFSSAGQRGKVVLVNFWATWCGPCQVEMPRLESEIWSKYKSSADFAMIGIAREQTSDVVAAFEKKKSYTFPLAPDPKRATYALFANAGIPRNYVIDRTGKIVYQEVGYSPEDFDKLKKAIDAAIAAK